MLPTITPTEIALPPGGEVILRQQTWGDYEALLHLRQDKAALKVTFNASTQEIRLMSPLPGHGKRSATLTDLVKALLCHQGQDWESFDPITLRRVQQTGIEPNQCFYIQNRVAILGKERVDLAVDPPPDLALEIDLTSLTQIADYEAIAIPEVWIYRRGQLQLYVFQDGHYQAVTASPLFPGISVQQLIPDYVERAWTEGSSIALRAFEQYLQGLGSGELVLPSCLRVGM